MRTVLFFAAGALAGVAATTGFGLWLFGDLLLPLEHLSDFKDGLRSSDKAELG